MTEAGILRFAQNDILTWGISAQEKCARAAMRKQEIQPKEKRSGTGDPARSPVPVSLEKAKLIRRCCESGGFVRPRELVPPFPERAVHRMTAVKEREHRGTAHADSFEGSADTEITPGRDHAFLKGVDRF